MIFGGFPIPVRHFVAFSMHLPTLRKRVKRQSMYNDGGGGQCMTHRSHYQSSTDWHINRADIFVTKASLFRQFLAHLNCKKIFKRDQFLMKRTTKIMLEKSVTIVGLIRHFCLGLFCYDVLLNLSRFVTCWFICI